jgi:hypothetical protein
MGGNSLGFEVVYRGENRDWIMPGSYVFFQRAKEYGGGYWFGQVYDDCFVFAIEKPVALREGIEFLDVVKGNERQLDVIQSVDDFTLL